MIVFQCIWLLDSLQDAILNHHAHAQKRTPPIAITMPMKHDCTLPWFSISLTIDHIKGRGPGTWYRANQNYVAYFKIQISERLDAVAFT